MKTLYLACIFILCLATINIYLNYGMESTADGY